MNNIDPLSCARTSRTRVTSASLRVMVLTAVLFLCFPRSAATQQSPWTPEDTITAGESDDHDPSLLHNASSYVSGDRQWVVFERTGGGAYMIAATALHVESGRWDTAVAIIAESNSPQGLPDCSESYYTVRDSTGPHEVPVGIIAWQRMVGSHWEIYYSVRFGVDTSWSAPVRFTSDSLDNTRVQVRPLDDSTFIFTWKRRNVLLFSLLGPWGSTTPDTIAVSSSDSTEYDIDMTWGYGSLVWTSPDSSGKNLMLLREIETYPGFSLTPPETLFFRRSAFKPRIVSGWPGRQVLFETVNNGRRDVCSWKSDGTGGHTVENLTTDSTADDRNPRGYVTPFITKTGATHLGYFDALAIERDAAEDTSLLVSQYTLTDTIRSAGVNRNPMIGSHIFGNAGGLFVPLVWESTRSGRSHIYGRNFSLNLGGVTPTPARPGEISLLQNYPNPFNPGTTISYVLPEASTVSLRIYDILGRTVCTAVAGVQTPGRHDILWDGTDDRGVRVASGVYLYRLEAASTKRPLMRWMSSRKMLLVR